MWLSRPCSRSYSGTDGPSKAGLSISEISARLGDVEAARLLMHRIGLARAPGPMSCPNCTCTDCVRIRGVQAANVAMGMVVEEALKIHNDRWMCRNRGCVIPCQCESPTSHVAGGANRCEVHPIVNGLSTSPWDRRTIEMRLYKAAYRRRPNDL